MGKKAKQKFSDRWKKPILTIFFGNGENYVKNVEKNVKKIKNMNIQLLR
jgi:hypothetical protein